MLTNIEQEVESSESSQSRANAQQTSWPRPKTERKMRNVEGGLGGGVASR